MPYRKRSQCVEEIGCAGGQRVGETVLGERPDAG